MHELILFPDDRKAPVDTYCFDLLAQRLQFKASLLHFLNFLRNSQVGLLEDGDSFL